MYIKLGWLIAGTRPQIFYRGQDLFGSRYKYNIVQKLSKASLTLIRIEIVSTRIKAILI